MFKPGTWASHAVALTLLVTILYCGYLFAVVPVSRTLSDTGNRIEQASMRLQKYRWLIGQYAELTREASEQLALLTQFNSMYLKGANDALAAADLLSLVKSAIEKAGGEIRSTEILTAEPISSMANVHRIGVRLRANTPFEGLAGALYALEGAQPYIIIDELVVGSNADDDRTEPGAEPMVEVTLKIVGIVLERSEAVK